MTKCQINMKKNTTSTVFETASQISLMYKSVKHMQSHFYKDNLINVCIYIYIDFPKIKGHLFRKKLPFI